MDGSSTLHSLRWKQICAGALGAASLIAGHLVLGEEAKPIHPAPSAAVVAAPADSFAPILDARAARRSSSPVPSGVQKSTAQLLPPILDSRKLPKPNPAEATFVPLEARPQSADEAEPVATLELTPSSKSGVAGKPTSGSPWMVDIDEALAHTRTDSPTPRAKATDKRPAEPNSALAPLINSADAKRSAPAAKGAAPQSNLGRDTFPLAELGAPQATTSEKTAAHSSGSVYGASPSDLRTPSGSKPKSSPGGKYTAGPQLNPFVAPPSVNSPTATNPTKTSAAVETTKPVDLTAPSSAVPLAAPSASIYAPATEQTAEKLPEIEEMGTPLKAPTALPPAVENRWALAGSASNPATEDVRAPLAPVVSAATGPKSTSAAAPRVADAANSLVEASTPAIEAPVVKAAETARKPAPNAAKARSETAPVEAPPVETAQHYRLGAKQERPQLTGYEIQGQGVEPPSQAQRQSRSASPELQWMPQSEPTAPQQFTQAEAPRTLPGMPAGPFEMIGESGTVSVMVRRSMLLRTQTDIYRTAVVDPAICDVIQFTPREVSIIGKSQGSTHVTFWFDGPNAQPITYLIKVEPDAAEVKKEEDKYKLLEDVVNEMFPDSKIQLLLVADKLIVKGQAKDSEEATQILSIIRTNARGGGGGAWGPGGWNGGAGGGLSEGAAADVLSDSATGSAARARYQVINMLRVPGVQQVALRVKIAELNRTAARGFGVDVHGNVSFSDSPEGTDLFFKSILNAAGGGGPALLAQFDGDDISVGIRYLQQQGVIRLLSEPTLVTLSGRPATFVAGGEFAVPTVVGSAGLNAVTTDFRAFGAIISFLPTVVDKDRIRLEVSPEFSQVNQDLAVNGTPGLKTRAVTTTVEMREGQTFAIAGLLEDNMNGTTIGDLPFLAQIFGRRSMQRAETELIILVTPELVHPMEAEEVPPLPGFDVTEPDNCQFFLGGKIEGTPTREYRSTVWPRLKNRYKAGGPAMTSGPFGHGQ